MSEQTQAAAHRRERKPFGTLGQKLAYPPREGYHQHWFNDAPGRIEMAKEAGYTQVMGKDGKAITRVVGAAEGGGALHAFLMETPEEWYKEDMGREQKRVDEIDAAIRNGQVQGKSAQDKDGAFYVGKQGINLRR